ncbi:PLP-dependent aspartate aminotransferase family protein [Saccharopolyspora sp. ASAGF58]|uniref:trans-sulfuration enzyme family protein n=1 Tax=Saccharopolyspora sp. ASAGF58 TaxID=2719023 RepID=UPI00143FDEE2|nr:aminotransferase class I/II-fold pyridoxal phosphate-dependent enzyme [Saccharopolyspora sp. ASAGF58]QIZ37376.1 aminotransferase class I/II-fold pyridoxal phosphate-dependent enzyme [Saccharopolyspora sp. ASAGF58]
MSNPSPPPSRPNKHDPATLAFQTQTVHCGNQADVGTGAIRTPIIMANSYALPADPYTLDPDNPDLLVYTRESGANQLALQSKLATLDGGDDAVVLGTGVAALHAMFFTHLNAGDHVIVSDVTYSAVWRLFSELLPVKSGIEATFVDVTDLDAVRAAIRPTTRIIHTEVIANPTVKTADIQALADIAHAEDALLTVDSTCTPPPMFRPLEHGADLVVHSLTKYINGHGDAMGGAVIGPRELILPIKTEAMINVGAAISPFNAWLISRGSITLPLRLRQHLANAQRVAEFLDGDPRVLHVAYPGLPSHPQHRLAKRQFGGQGFGAMIAFALDADHDTRNAFVNSLRLITSAVSLGHDETLIVYEDTPAGRAAMFPEVFRTHGLLRLAVGLEDPDDLIADLAAALDTAVPAP